MVGRFHGNRNIRNLIINLLFGIGQWLVAVNNLTITLVRGEIGRSVLTDEPAKPCSHIQQFELCE